MKLTSRLLCVTAAAVLLVVLPAPAESARSCKPKKEERGCVVKRGEWGAAGFNRAAHVSVVAKELHHTVTMMPGTVTANYPSAPPRCAVVMSTQTASIFGRGPDIKGPIKVGRTYSGQSEFHTDRTQPGFRDPGAAFGGETYVEEIDATYRLTVKVLSAGRVRVTASGTTSAKLRYRDPNSPDHDPQYLEGSFSCRGTYAGTIKRGNY